MSHLELERNIQKENRQKRRRLRRERIAKLLGLVVGFALNTRWIGLVVGAAAIAVVLVIISRLL